MEVALVIRGTQSIHDILSDALAETVSFHGGVAHAGCVKAGTWIADSYTKLILKMVNEGPEKVHLRIIGHSLGAGAAVTAAIELRNNPDILQHLGRDLKVEVVGFGCPAIVSKDIALACENFVTTIINDDDIIPRTSITAMKNFVFDVSSFDWTRRAKEDIEDALLALETRVPSVLNKFLEFGGGKMSDELCKKIQSWPVMPSNKRAPLVVFPPGRCLHLYRNSFTTFNCAWTPAPLFDEIPASTNMIEDHYVKSYDEVLARLCR